MLNMKKQKFDTIPNEVTVATMIISVLLSLCTAGIGPSLGTYPPEFVPDVINYLLTCKI